MSTIEPIKLVTRKVKQTVIDSMAIGRKCMYERTVSGCTLKTMSAEMGISVAYLSNLEHGRREWNPLLVKKANVALAMIRLMRANDRLARQTKRMTKNAEAKD